MQSKRLLYYTPNGDASSQNFSWNFFSYSDLWPTACSGYLPVRRSFQICYVLVYILNMSTRNIPGGKGGRCVRLTTSRPSCFMWRMLWKSGNLNLLEPSGPHRACYGTALPLVIYTWKQWSSSTSYYKKALENGVQVSIKTSMTLVREVFGYVIASLLSRSAD